MAFPGVATADEHTVSAFLKSLKDELRIHATAAHDAYYIDIGGIFKTGGPGEVSAAIRAPVAQEADNPRLKLIRHTSFLLNYLANTPSI
jgi:hypothetical protein